MILAILTAFTGCSANVSPEKVYGLYVATYPYGTESISLNRDWTFLQRVEIKQKQPVAIRGKWEFNPKESRVTLYGAMIVDDGFGHLRENWQIASKGLFSESIEMIWFRIVMGSGSSYPYSKQ